MDRKNRVILITEKDLERLSSLIDRLANNDHAKALEDELSYAKIVRPEEIPPTVVTMNSKVRFVDTETGKERLVQLVYPSEADVNEDRISILSPVGTALLGLSVGESIEWPLPMKKTKMLRIEEVPYQPESAGDWEL